MSAQEFNKDQFLRDVEQVFGTYRAELVGDDLFRHFTQPSYFLALEGFRPCVLQGGRGSGKTTALKGLSYIGQYELHGCDIGRFDDEVNYIGLYQCIDTNHVRSFVGAGIPVDRWMKYFGHYFNLIVILDLVSFLEWHVGKNYGDAILDSEQIKSVLALLGIVADTCCDYSAMRKVLEEELYRFQGVINNVQYWEAHQGKVYLSVIGDPINVLAKSVLSLDQFVGKHIYIILDEYENLEDYQQILLNTMLKHPGEFLTFKIGVRELGWRKKYTLNESELLYDPADYTLLDIKESFAHGMNFSDFAKTVCQKRFNMLVREGLEFDVAEIFMGMSPEEEAIALGVEDHELMKGFDLLPDKLRKVALTLPPLYRFVMAYWADSRNGSLSDCVFDYVQNKQEWDVRYDNYKYHLLFKINIGRGSGRLQKYYCGFDTYVKLASGNIRFLMELIHNAYVAHIEDGFGPTDKVSPITQTNSAKSIGLKNLTQLECECREGSRIVRLLIGLGRVFELLAKAKSIGKPEVNQFFIDGVEQDDEIQQLINTAVKNLALERTAGTKLSRYETKEFEYNVHPIFAPHFSFSYRRKRKMGFSLQTIKLMTSNPSEAVRIICGGRGVDGIDVTSSTDGIQLELGL